MWTHLRNLQNKPLHTRKVILHVSTIIIFLIILFFWVLILNIQKVNEIDASREGVPSPFDGVKEIFTNMFEMFESVKTNIPEIPQEMIRQEVLNQPIAPTEPAYNQLETSTTTANMKQATGTPNSR